MTSIRKYAKTITQKTGRYAIQKSYSEFTNINNIKDESNTFATSNITAASGIRNRPSTLILTDFDFQLPGGSTVTKIRVHYKMKKTAEGNVDVNLAPVIFRVTGAGAEFEIHGKSPTNVASDFTSAIDTLSFIGVNTENINRSFQLEMDFPANTGGAGSIDLYYVVVEIIYEEGVYVLSATTDKNQVVEKDTFDITLSLSNINHTNRYHTPVTRIIIPDGVTYQGSTNDNFVKKSGNTLEWTSLFISEWVDTVTLTFQAVNTGDKTFKMQGTDNQYNYQLVLGVVPKQVVLDLDLPEYGVEDKSFDFTATSTDWGRERGQSNLESRTIKIELPAQFNITIDGDNNASLDTSSEEKTVITWHIAENTPSEMLSCTVTPLQTGIFTFNGYDEHNVLIASKDIKIAPSSYTTPFLSKFKIPDNVLDKMEHGRVYSIITYMRVNISEEDIDNFEHYEWNYRFSIFHDSGTPEQYEDNQYLLNTLGLEKSINQPNEWVKFELSFYYDSNYPIWLFWTGEYLERSPTLFNIEFTNPILEETPYYFEKGVEPYGLYFNPLKNVISPINYGSCIIPAMNKANPFRVSGLSFGGVENIKNFVLQGITIHFDAVSSSSCSLVARLRTSDNRIGERSIIIPEGSKSLELGGPFDLFGIKYTDFIDPTRLEVEFEAINKYNHDVKLELSNIRFTIRYSILGNSNWLKFWIDGESSEYYNVFLKKLTLDAGTETTVTYFSAEGCDTTIASRQNIDPKTIEMEIEVGECNLDESTLLFRRAAKWLSNNRTKHNKPILKNIEFEHIPGQIYPYILEDPLDGKLEITEYDSKVKLKVPNGVSVAKEATYTAEVGVVNGITRVRPKIRAIALSDEITITEKYSGQSWSIYSDALDAGDILTIDCDKRTVMLDKSTTTGQTDINITQDVDLDCDWFNIKGEFVFQSSSCSIQFVEYKEREL